MELKNIYDDYLFNSMAEKYTPLWNQEELDLL